MRKGQRKPMLHLQVIIRWMLHVSTGFTQSVLRITDTYAQVPRRNQRSALWYMPCVSPVAFKAAEMQVVKQRRRGLVNNFVIRRQRAAYRRAALQVGGVAPLIDAKINRSATGTKDLAQYH